jgi:hypothetical protein
MTAGHNALRGSGPGQKLAFDNALALVGFPDRRIDRFCITINSGQEPQSSGEAVVSSKGLEVAAKQAMLTRQLIGDEACLWPVLLVYNAWLLCGPTGGCDDNTECDTGSCCHQDVARRFSRPANGG